MKNTVNNIRSFIIRRCNERIQAERYTNRNPHLYDKAVKMKYEIGNIIAPVGVCRYLVEREAEMRDIIIKAAAYSQGRKAYENKIKLFGELLNYAKSYLQNGRPVSMDVMVMRRGESMRVISFERCEKPDGFI